MHLKCTSNAGVCVCVRYRKSATPVTQAASQQQHGATTSTSDPFATVPGKQYFFKPLVATNKVVKEK